MPSKLFNGENTLTTSLYERLGGTDGIKSIANDLVDNHYANPVIGTRFAAVDRDKVKNGAATFFITGSGGPSDAYKGKDMLSVHANMNINNNEIVAALDDAMAALDKNGIGQREKEEVLFILYSLSKEFVGK